MAKQWLEIYHQFTLLHMFVFPLEVAEFLDFCKTQGISQIWEQSSWAVLGGGEKTWKLWLSVSTLFP